MGQREGGLRIGQAAELLGVSVDTIRRWDADGRLHLGRTDGGQRRVPLAEVSRLLAERRAGRRAGRRAEQGTREPVITAQSARNRFEGVVSRVEVDRVAAVVEVLAGPHRLVSLMTAEAVADLGLEVGRQVVCAVKATNVIVEIAR